MKYLYDIIENKYSAYVGSILAIVAIVLIILLA